LPAVTAHQTEPCSRAAHWIGRTFLWVFGWRLEGELPPDPRFVALGAPHTSNWDLPVVVSSAWALGVRMRFLAKREIFGPATGWLFRAMGGIPVERSSPQGLVDELVEAFALRERLALMIPPDGTRGRRDCWKSGFYHVALGAGVPVVASYADYARKRTGIAGWIRLSGDVRADMDAIRELYAGITPRHPERMTPIRLAAEVDAT
jgi:1-acyl-sn-glycerol-3-phosphate acyltransferase